MSKFVQCFSGERTKALPLERCMRFLPHHQVGRMGRNAAWAAWADFSAGTVQKGR